MDRQADKWIEGQMERQTKGIDRLTDRQMDRQTDRWINGRMTDANGWMDRCEDRQRDGWTDRQDKCTLTSTIPHGYFLPLVLFPSAFSMMVLEPTTANGTLFFMFRISFLSFSSKTNELSSGKS
jgi:hypothetical protein